LLCFDPAGKGDRPVRLFQSAAESHGYIVVGSYNSHNGPWEDNKLASEAMFRDVISRWPIDGRRVYAVGFSGGARWASNLGTVGVARAVVACSAGFPAGDTPEEVRFDFYGTTGSEDMNREEMVCVECDLSTRPIAHALKIFHGGHEWMPERLTSEALDWLDSRFRHVGIRDRYTTLIGEEFKERLAAARTLPRHDAFLEYSALASDFKGLLELNAVHKELKAIRKSARIGETEQQAVKHRAAAFSEYLRRAREHTSPLAALTAQWQDRANFSDDTPDRREARSLVAAAMLHCASEARASLAAKSDFTAARAYAEYAMQLRPNHPILIFNFACLQALEGNPAGALATLQLAARAGFKDIQLAWTEPAFTSLRGERAFQVLLQAMKN
jgi:dienelactone hydrolase